MCYIVPCLRVNSTLQSEKRWLWSELNCHPRPHPLPHLLNIEINNTAFCPWESFTSFCCVIWLFSNLKNGAILRCCYFLPFLVTRGRPCSYLFWAISSVMTISVASLKIVRRHKEDVRKKGNVSSFSNYMYNISIHWKICLKAGVISYIFASHWSDSPQSRFYGVLFCGRLVAFSSKKP
jgi:hypothetical protein